jgi:tRNA(fMet)-specific endonuclease VapC
MLYIFDTDHLSLYQRSNAVLMNRILSLDYGMNELATTVVNYQEQISGRFKQVQQAKNSPSIVAAYDFMCETITFFENWSILPYDNLAETYFKSSRKASVRIGTMDLRIAAIALSLDATVVTRNRKDFQQVPGLKFADWSV